MHTRDPKKVLIGIAIGNGSLRWETMFSLIRSVASTTGYEIELIPGGGCDVCHARNLMFHYWRTRSDAGILLFVDSDEKFGPEHIVQLLSWFANPQVRYVGGLYPLKGTELRWSYGGWSKHSEKVPGLWEVFELCTGFTALRFDLLEDLISHYPETAFEVEDFEYKGETAYEICAMGPVKRVWPVAPAPREYVRRVPEDFYLSLRARDIGETIYVDPTIQLGHVGPFDFLNLHKIGAKQTAQGHA